jgi:hypothetical protein
MECRQDKAASRNKAFEKKKIPLSSPFIKGGKRGILQSARAALLLSLATDH